MSTKYFRMDPFACGSNVWSVFRTEFLSYINTTAPHTLHMIKTQCSRTSAVRTGTTDYRNETLTICYRLFLLSLSLYITQMFLQKLQLWWLIVAKTLTNPTAWSRKPVVIIFVVGCRTSSWKMQKLTIASPHLLSSIAPIFHKTTNQVFSFEGVPCAWWTAEVLKYLAKKCISGR